MKTRTKIKTADKPRDLEFGEINIHELEKEWIRQDNLVGYYGQQLALAKRKLEEVKSATQVFEAETARRIRRKPAVYGVKRLTEAAVKEVVSIELLTSKEHDNLIRARYRVEMLENAMKRLEHRKRLLTDMVYLHGQGYFSRPTIPNNSNARRRMNKHKDNFLQVRDRNGQNE